MKQSNSKLVSIGIPTYNRGYNLTGCIESLLAQTYKQIEILISDNCSTDDTQKILKKYKNNQRIKIFTQKKNLGMVKNFNFLLEKASGKYFMWAADDDLWDKEYIETLFSLLEKDPKSCLAISNYEYFNINIKQKLTLKKVEEGKVTLPHFYIFFLNISQNIAHLGSYIYGLFNTKKLKEIGGFYDDKRFLYGANDLLTIYKIIFLGSIKYTSKYLFHKRDSGFVLSSDEVLKKSKMSREVLFKIFKFLTSSIYLILDFFSLLWITFVSRYTLKDKMFLFGKVISFFLKTYTGYILTITKGILIVIKRVLHLPS